MHNEEIKNENTTINDLDELYSKYLIEDLDFLSQSSNDDIDIKMNKMINIIKRGGNINNIIDKKDIKEKEKKDEKNKKKYKRLDEKEKEKKNEKTEHEKVEEEFNNISSIKKTSSVYKKNDTIAEEKKQKISSKIKKLEILKKKEEKYLDIINLQSKIREKNIKLIENQINRQTNKNENINKGINASETDSKVDNGLDPDMVIENGIAFLSHLFENHLTFLKLDFFQNLLDRISTKKPRNKKSVDFKLEKQKTYVTNTTKGKMEEKVV